MHDSQSTRRVLLVGLSDDEREIFGGCLQRNGFVVQAFADPEVALAVATDTSPAAIVTRLWERGPTDGVELTRRVRAHPATRDVAVVVVTTRIEPECGAAALDAGCDAFLLLPATAELVVSEVERGMARRTAGAKRSIGPLLEPVGSVADTGTQPITPDAASSLIVPPLRLVTAAIDEVVNRERTPDGQDARDDRPADNSPPRPRHPPPADRS